MIKPIHFIVFASVIAALVALMPAKPVVTAAVVPVAPGQELYNSIRADKITDRKVTPRKRDATVVAGLLHPVVIEGHCAVQPRAKKVFSAAQFICKLPIEDNTTYTAVCSDAAQAVATVKKLKERGCRENTLNDTTPGAEHDAIVRTARENDMRINA